MILDQLWSDQIWFPDREDPKWNASQLNNILCRHIIIAAHGAWQKWLLAAHFRVHWMGVRTVQRSHVSPLLPLQHAKASVHNMNNQVCCSWFMPCLSHTPGLYWTYTIPAGHCAHCAPVSFCLGRPLGRPSSRVLGCPHTAFSHPVTCPWRPTDRLQPKASYTYGKDNIRVTWRGSNVYELNTRWADGCGSLGEASLVWGDWDWESVNHCATGWG